MNERREPGDDVRGEFGEEGWHYIGRGDFVMEEGSGRVGRMDLQMGRERCMMGERDRKREETERQ